MMEEKIREHLRISKMIGLKKPKILMNSDDFVEFKTDLQSNVINLDEGYIPTFEGVPIESNNMIQKGNIVIADSFYMNQDPFIDKLTAEDVTDLRYSWNQLGDLERYSGSERVMDILKRDNPELYQTWQNYKEAEKRLDELIVDLKS